MGIFKPTQLQTGNYYKLHSKCIGKPIATLGGVAKVSSPSDQVKWHQLLGKFLKNYKSHIQDSSKSKSYFFHISATVAPSHLGRPPGGPERPKTAKTHTFKSIRPSVLKLFPKRMTSGGFHPYTLDLDLDLDSRLKHKYKSFIKTYCAKAYHFKTYLPRRRTNITHKT